jgi:murein DD-endopeptidase MepM/ murein hydrolase activator NlpD
MYKFFVAGHPFDCDARIITWHESGWDATAERCIFAENIPHCPDGGTRPYGEKALNTTRRRYSFRHGLGNSMTPDLKAVQAIIRMFTVHLDGCASAKMCFSVLHDERGISVPFLIDNNGDIYQTIDLALMAFQAGGFNQHSIGAELANRGDAKKYPNYYDKHNDERGPKRGLDTVKINESVYLAYKFNQVQIDTLEELARALRYACPNIPIDYPQEKPGQQSWKTLPQYQAQAFSGYMGHFHQTANKWDPGPFDFRRFCDRVRGQPCFPVATRKMENGMCQKIPDDEAELGKQAKELYALNEAAQGGFFPVSPTGERRLWHGGVHLMKAKGEPVVSTFPGLIVAARFGASGPLGSDNFVLLRHDMTVGSKSVRFFSVYYHLDDELRQPTPVEWLKGCKDFDAKKAGQVQFLGEPVQAGTMVGRVGEAGPSSARGAQIHFEIFGRDPFVQDLELLGNPKPGTWTLIDGTTGGRFCDDPTILGKLDTSPADGKVTPDEIGSFFKSGGDRESMYHLAVLSQSEWNGTREDWVTALRTSQDFADLDDEELGKYVDEQLVPGLWWTKELAKHAKIPADGIVFHFHPVALIKFLYSKMFESASDNESVGSWDATQAKETGPNVKDDFEDTEGASAFDPNELQSKDDSDDWPLDKLVQGFSE